MQTELEAHLMDILTHAGIGLMAAPLLNSHPELATGALLNAGKNLIETKFYV